MHGEMLASTMQKALYLVLTLSALPLAVAIVVGFGVGLFQALTQIQDQSLPQVVKLVAVLVAIIALGPWMASELVRYSGQILDGFPLWTR
jgi:type III secretion protein S